MLHPHLWPDTTTVDEQGHLVVGGCDTTALAHEHGTPLYLLDAATFRDRCRAYCAALARGYSGPGAIHYAGKALLNTAVAQLVAAEGLGLDVVSGGELYVALRAGFPAARIHVHGNAKPRAELEQALAAAVGTIVVDTLDELDLLAQLTKGRSEPQPIMLRLAPDIAADTHAHIQTGRAASKFGLPLDALDAAAQRVIAAPGLRLAGLHAHLGSQIFDYAPIVGSIEVLLDCAAQLRARHALTIAALSPGGGLGAPYTAEQAPPDLEGYTAAIGRALQAGCRSRGLPLPRLVIEPGRSIVARAAVAIYTVVATKPLPTTDHRPPTTDERPTTTDQRPATDYRPTTDHRPPTNDQRPTANEDREWKIEDGGASASDPPSSILQAPSSVLHPPPATRYLHVDGGMADNIRPALYGARYSALLANRANAAPEEIVHVAGRYCESGDVLLRDIPLARAAAGDLLAVAVAGAYTLSMASNYNLTPRPALLLLDGGRAQVIQRRETYADLAARDRALTSD